MIIDWSQLIWQGRWTSIEIFANAIAVNTATHWWFGPLLLALIAAGGYKALPRLAAHILRVFMHTH